MNRTIIHFGLHKTGSTWLQKMVLPLLKDTIVISRPYTMNNSVFNKLQFADDTIYDRHEFHNTIKSILSSKANQQIVISDETLSGMPKFAFLNRAQNAQRLSVVFPEAEALIVIRGQNNLIGSLISQGVKSGWLDKDVNQSIWFTPNSDYHWDEYVSYLENPKSPKENIQTNRMYYNHLYPFHIDHFDYNKIIQLYQSHFKTVHILLYEDLKNQPLKFINQLENIFETKITAHLTDIVLNNRLKVNKTDKLKLRNKTNQLHIKNKLIKRTINGLLLLDKKFHDSKINQFSLNEHQIETFRQRNQLLYENYPFLKLDRYEHDYFL